MHISFLPSSYFPVCSGAIISDGSVLCFTAGQGSECMVITLNTVNFVVLPLINRTKDTGRPKQQRVTVMYYTVVLQMNISN